MENTCHDNDAPGADRASEEGEDDEIGYAELRDVSIAAAVAWAHGLDEGVTLLLYDEGDGV